MRLLIAALTLALVLTTNARAEQARPISIDVRDADIADVIALLANESRKNIIADGSVRPQKITLRLRNVPFSEALAALVHSYDLAVRREGTILVIGSAANMNRHYAGSGDNTSPVTIVVTLKHAKADDVAKALSDALPAGVVVVPDKRSGSVIVTADKETTQRAARLISALDGLPPGPALSATHALALKYLRPSELLGQLKGLLPDGSFIADDRQNAIIVSGNLETFEAASALITSMDVPTPQVLFEVKVADVQPENEESSIGLQFGGVDLGGQPVAGATTYAFTNRTISVNARLNALISTGHATILATPKLMTLNNHEADLLIGQTYPVVYYDAKLGGQQVQFVDIGVKLRLTPTIGSDGSVTAEMHPEYSAIQSFVGGYPVLANRRVDSTLRVRDRDTIVLGGLLRDIESETVTRVPYLADIPVFGSVFKNRNHTHERDEIVFLITPHVLTGSATISR